jgi:hypothetical protein
LGTGSFLGGWVCGSRKLGYYERIDSLDGIDFSSFLTSQHQCDMNGSFLKIEVSLEHRPRSIIVENYVVSDEGNEMPVPRSKQFLG